MPTQYLRLFCFADVDAEKRIDESMTWKLKFGHKVIFCSEFQYKVWSNFKVVVQMRF